jgi:integrase/recombinase XerC
LRRAEVCGLDREDFYPAEARLLLKGKGRIDKEWIDLAPATVEAISAWLASMGETKSTALFVSSQDTRLSRHKNLSTLIRYDDGRQQLQGKAAKKLAESITWNYLVAV